MNNNDLSPNNLGQEPMITKDNLSEKLMDKIGKTVAEEDHLIVNSQSLTPYEKWLQQEGKKITEKLKSAQDTDTLTQELSAEFAAEFKRFLNGTLLVKIKKRAHSQIISVPVEVTIHGYKEMRHPFLTEEWEVSKPVNMVKNQERFHIGDIVAVNFSATKNINYLSSLLFLHLDDAEILPKNLKESMSDLVQPQFFDELEHLVSNESIEALLVQRLIQCNREIKDAMHQDLAQQQDLLAAIEQKKQNIIREQKELDKSEKEWFTLLLKIKELMGEPPMEAADESEKLPYRAEEFIEDLQKLFYHNNEEKSLLYETSLIRSFFHSLQANVLTVLTGPSGTGKSSIVEVLEECLENVEVKMISVQSSWTDAQDLLGYFHPTDKAFVPTPFMEVLAEAAREENGHKLYIICLDEMNLAHVEYYFSEILSAREKKIPSVYLYPKKHEEMAKLILSDEQASLERKRNAAELLSLYPAEFILPKNVRFVGTLNMDHTVKPLSPKVLDRSFIIEINHLSILQKKALKQRLSQTELQGKISYDFERFTKKKLAEEETQHIIRKIEQISEIVEQYPNASLYSRGYKHIRDILSYTQSVEIAEQLVDAIILGKVLPRIEVKRTLLEPIISPFTESIRMHEQSLQKWNSMLMKQHTVNFW